jgi:hypothetical protein
MPLNKEKLKTDIISCFDIMKNKAGEEGFDGDTEFASGLSTAFKTFGESGSITTVDSGKIATGIYTGAGNGNLVLSIDKCKKTIEDACSEMKNNKKDDAYLAQEISKGLSEMFGETDIVETKTNGSAVNEATGITTPYVNVSWKGNISISFAPFQFGSSSFFVLMQTGDRTDEDLATEIANLLDTTIRTGVVSTKGSGDMSGAIGTGTIS